MTTDNFCFYLQNRLIQTSKQEVNGTVILPPLVFPELYFQLLFSKLSLLNNLDGKEKKNIFEIFLCVFFSFEKETFF
jgi:hypothetical protein